MSEIDADLLESAAPLFAASASSTWNVRYVKRRVYPSTMSAPDRSRLDLAIRELPGAMHGELTTLDIKGPLQAVPDRKVFRLRVGDWRVFFTAEDDGVTIYEIGRRDEGTYNPERLVTVRRGGGVAFVETVAMDSVADQTPVAEARQPVTPRAARPSCQNPLTPFTNVMLEQMGLGLDAVAAVRTFRESISIAEELADRGLPSETVQMVSDAWEDPSRYLAIFDSGSVPGVEEAGISDEELAERLSHPDSAESVATLGANGLALILDQDIEAWMFYLHPSQVRIVTAKPTGPALIRGGPGTGKTVAALHRARFLVESGLANDVLLTTFITSLPKAWTGLLSRFAPSVKSSITAESIDRLAMKIVKEADGHQDMINDDGRDSILADALRKEPAAAAALGGVKPFGTEIERFILGRGIASLDEYLGASRRGSGRALDRAQREAVWKAFELYQSQLLRAGKKDWAGMKIRALELALAGAGPRFDAIIVDEAQDLTEVGIRFLMALDRSEDHLSFLLVGDGQQAIYPGGFSLRSLGLEVRGRSFVLRTNWRNTDAIASAAEALQGDVAVFDLGEDLEITDGSALLPRRIGEPPIFHLAESQPLDDVLRLVVSGLLDRMAPGDVGVLSRTNAQQKSALAALITGGYPATALRDYSGEHADAVRCGTFHYSKGLEFKAVVLFDAGGTAWGVEPYWLSAPSDQEEWWANETRLLFVGMTRARDQLEIVGSAKFGGAAAAARNEFDLWEW